MRRKNSGLGDFHTAREEERGHVAEAERGHIRSLRESVERTEPAAKAPVLNVKFESNAKHVQLSPVGTSTFT